MTDAFDDTDALELGRLLSTDPIIRFELHQSRTWMFVLFARPLLSLHDHRFLEAVVMEQPTADFVEHRCKVNSESWHGVERTCANILDAYHAWIARRLDAPQIVRPPSELAAPSLEDAINLIKMYRATALLHLKNQAEPPSVSPTKSKSVSVRCRVPLFLGALQAVIGVPEAELLDDGATHRFMGRWCVPLAGVPEISEINDAALHRAALEIIAVSSTEAPQELVLRVRFLKSEIPWAGALRVAVSASETPAPSRLLRPDQIERFTVTLDGRTEVILNLTIDD